MSTLKLKQSYIDEQKAINQKPKLKIYLGVFSIIIGILQPIIGIILAIIVVTKKDKHKELYGIIGLAVSILSLAIYSLS